MVTMADWFWTTVGDQYSGTMNATLPAMLAEINAGRTANGQAAITLPALVAAVNGGRQASSSLAATLGEMTSSASGSRAAVGTLAATLGEMTTAIAGGILPEFKNSGHLTYIDGTRIYKQFWADYKYSPGGLDPSYRFYQGYISEGSTTWQYQDYADVSDTSLTDYNGTTHYPESGYKIIMSDLRRVDDFVAGKYTLVFYHSAIDSYLYTVLEEEL